MTIKMAYAGQRLAANNQLAQAWVPVDSDEQRIYGKGGLVKYAAIGAIYEFTTADNGESILVGGKNAPVRTRDEWMDNDMRLIWESRDANARRAHEEVALRKREKDISLLREALLPIRVAMARKPRQTLRSAMVNAVNEELWRPLTKAEREEAGLK